MLTSTSLGLQVIIECLWVLLYAFLCFLYDCMLFVLLVTSRFKYFSHQKVSLSIVDHWCYDSFTYFSHSFSSYTLYMLLPHAYYFLFTFFFPSTDFLFFHVQLYCLCVASCTVLHSLLTNLLMHSLVTQYIRTGQTVVFSSYSLIDDSSSTLDFLKPLKTTLVG